MKIVPTLSILCALFVCIVLIGTACNDNTPGKTPPPVPPPPPESEEPSPDPHEAFLENFMTAEDSKKWLEDNHFQVRKNAEGNGYIITCNYYDPGPPPRQWESRTSLSDRATASISGPANATVTIDRTGQLRVWDTRRGTQ